MSKKVWYVSIIFDNNSQSPTNDDDKTSGWWIVQNNGINDNPKNSSFPLLSFLHTNTHPRLVLIS